MKTVQVAIHDPEYADSVRQSLLQDGYHSVFLVNYPDITLGGVILVEAAELSSFPWLAEGHEHLLVIVSKERDDLEKIWNAGVRHAVFYGDPPQLARVSILALELCLSVHRPAGAKAPAGSPAKTNNR
jgi:hypothetical protein